jgi:heme A synthase
MVHIAFAGGVLLILQAIAGYVTVKLDNVDWSVALHLSLALCWISIFIWQWLLWLHRTTGLWPSARIAKADARAMLPLLVGSAVALLFLIILGAWVASTAGGAYNQSCSTGYSTGWPKCLGEWWPTFGTTGVLVQMVHRVGALLVGVVLIWASLRLREKNSEAEGSLKIARLPSRLLDAAAVFWLLNLFIGGLYIISAGAEGFIESLSLLHLMVGVSSFLVLMTAVLLCCVAIVEPLPLEQE